MKYEGMFRTLAGTKGAQRRAVPATSSGFSFCIITNGKRIGKLQEELASIHALGMSAYEILVTGELPPEMPVEGFTYHPLPDAARKGQLGAMRNHLCQRARFDHLVVADDDLLFQPDFYQGLLRNGDDYDVLCVKFLNIDGSRYWGWATHGGPRGHVLLDYGEPDPFLYVTGGLCIMKSWVSGKVQWDAVRGINQLEDVDFSRRLQAAGVRISFCPYAAVVHNDWRYIQCGKVVIRIDNDLERAAAYFFSISWEAGMAFLDRANKTFCGDAAIKERLFAILAAIRATAPPASQLSGQSAQHR